MSTASPGDEGRVATSPWAVGIAVTVAVACLLVVVALAVSALRGDDLDAVEGLPTVAEVVVAQAHRHGIELPELTPEQQQALAAPLAPGTTDSVYEQLSLQLGQVALLDGVESAVFLLGEVAASSPDAAQVCDQIFVALSREAGSLASSMASPCPNSR